VNHTGRGTRLAIAAAVAAWAGACGAPPPAQGPGTGAVAAMLAGDEAEAFARAMRDGRMRFRDRDYRGAVAGYERALAINPGDPLVLYLIAIAAAQGGEAEAALDRLGVLADADSAVVPFPEDFPDLTGDARFRAVAARLAAEAARHRRAILAFRLPEPGLLVEGIVYDPVGKAFYAAAGRRRKLVRIRDGDAAQDFIAPRPDLDSPGGMRVDAARHRLWVVTGTDERMDGYVASEPERNALVEVDLDTGAIAGMHPWCAAPAARASSASRPSAPAAWCRPRSAQGSTRLPASTCSNRTTRCSMAPPPAR
jgi:hypothetical protein